MDMAELNDSTVTLPNQSRIQSTMGLVSWPRVYAAVLAPIGVAIVTLGLFSELSWPLVIISILAAGVTLPLATFIIVQPLRSQIATLLQQYRQQELEIIDLETRATYMQRLERTLAESETESQAIQVLLRSAQELLPDSDISLLLALPDSPRVGWQISLVGNEMPPAEALPTTPMCTAIKSGKIVQVSSSHGFDASEHQRLFDSEVSVVDVPITINDRLFGALSVQGAPGELPPEPVVDLLDWSIHRFAATVARQQAARPTPTSTRLDPVTGLPGPQHLNQQLRGHIRALDPFSLAIIDVDQYVELLASEGSEFAEEVLAVMADVMCATVRPDDVVCRVGESQLGVIFAHCDAEQAMRVLERAREQLILTLAEEEIRPFTFSAGIIESHEATSIEDLTARAGESCLRARTAGGNRVHTSRHEISQ